MYKPKNISWSQVNKYQTCGQQYHYSKVLGLPETFGVGLIIGSLGDEVVTGKQGFWHDMIEKGEPNPKRKYAEEFKKDADAKLKIVVDSLEPEDVETYVSEVPRVQQMIDEYCQPNCTMHSHLKPISVQKEYNVRFRGLKFPIKGYADLIADNKDTGRRVIVDLKIMKQKSYGGTVAQRYQTALYAFAEMQDQGLEELPYAEIHGLIKKKKPELDFTYFAPSSDDVTQVLQMCLNLQFGLESNHFPLNRQSNLCNAKYCSYYEKCHKDNSRDLETLKALYEKA
jgi:hypothetical protein